MHGHEGPLVLGSNLAAMILGIQMERCQCTELHSPEIFAPRP